MQNHNAKLKTLFILLFCIPILLGCAGNVDLRQQAKENKLHQAESPLSSPGAAYVSNNKNPASENKSLSNKSIKILFVGDMMFDRHIREAVEKYGAGNYNYILEPLKEKLSEYDLIVGNLEGPITEKESVSMNTKMGESKNFVFTFDPAVAGVLAENNIKLVNLGNNHILNQGEKGLAQTKKYLGEAGLEYFDEGSTFVKEIGGLKIGFEGYNYSVPNSKDAAVENIENAKRQADMIIVCPHWGTEYKTGNPGETVRALARRFIDAGADAIIGTHPHVVEDSEEYDGKKIFFSLGNFVFDQYFQPETMAGLGVEMTVNPDGSLQYDELNFVMNKRGQTELK